MKYKDDGETMMTVVNYKVVGAESTLNLNPDPAGCEIQGGGRGVHPKPKP